MRKMESTVEQMNTFFEPRAVAVIGASRRTMKAGHVIFKNFVINKRRNLLKQTCTPLTLTKKPSKASPVTPQFWI